MYIPTTLLRSTCLLLCSLLPVLPAVAQTKPDAAKATAGTVPSEPGSTTATYGSWVLRCVQMQAAPQASAAKSSHAADQLCEVVQTVQVEGQQQPIAQIAIGHLPNDKDLILTVLLPVNVSLPGSVHVSGNGKSGADEKGGLDLNWSRCFAASCAASAKPPADHLAQWRAGTEGQLRFADAAGQIAAIPMSWIGFDQAMAALEKAQ